MFGYFFRSDCLVTLVILVKSGDDRKLPFMVCKVLFVIFCNVWEKRKCNICKWFSIAFSYVIIMNEGRCEFSIEKFLYSICIETIV